MLFSFIKSATQFTFCDFTDAADAFRDVTFPSLRADVGLDAGWEPPPPPDCEVREAGRDWTGVGGFSTTDSGLDVTGVVGYIAKENHWNNIQSKILCI